MLVLSATDDELHRGIHNLPDNIFLALHSAVHIAVIWLRNVTMKAFAK